MNLEGVNTGCLYTETAMFFFLLHILQSSKAYDHRFCLHMKTETIYTAVAHLDLEKKGGGGGRLLFNFLVLLQFLVMVIWAFTLVLQK